jgi:hypothetical protein
MPLSWSRLWILLINNNVKLNATSKNYRWIPLDADSAKANGEDNYVVQALLRLNAWNPNYM